MNSYEILLHLFENILLLSFQVHFSLQTKDNEESKNILHDFENYIFAILSLFNGTALIAWMCCVNIMINDDQQKDEYTENISTKS